MPQNELNGHKTTAVTTLSNNGFLTTDSVQTRGATQATLLVDDGTDLSGGDTIGGSPPEYDYELQHRPSADAEWMPFSGETGTTSRSWTVAATPNFMRVVLKNTAGGENDYRVRLVLHGGSDD
jgi:hypothetical protein